MSSELAETLVNQLRAAGMTCATAESCTGGGIGSAITAVPGASAVFLGGVISYDNSVKERVLGVSPEVLNGVGPVSEACARQMAAGVRRLLQADLAVAVTGLAGPGSDGEHPAGYVWLAVASAQGTEAFNFTFPGDRARVREAAVIEALRICWRASKTGHFERAKPDTLKSVIPL